MQKQKITFIRIVLSPLSIIYGAITALRNLLFDWGVLPAEEFRLPVVSVGNITVGGTGKTPHVEYLAKLLQEEFNVAVLSRGYKRKTRHFMVANQASPASEIGDEPRQIKQKYPGITVAVDRRRANGIRQLLKLSKPVDLVLLDDAYQHRYVKPGKSILLIDYNRPITEDMLLPAGRLRESASSKNRADIILITKSPQRLKPIEMRNMVKRLGLGLHQHLYFTTMKYDPIRPVFSIEEVKDQAFFREKKAPVLLLTGISNPRPIRTFARSISTRLYELTFRDHHRYTGKDIQKLQEKLTSIDSGDTLILTTEKDAMRLQETDIPEELKSKIYYVPIRVEFLNEDQEEFNQNIRNYVRSNKRNNILHKEPDRTTT